MYIHFLHKYKKIQIFTLILYMSIRKLYFTRQLPNQIGSTSSRPITEVKQFRARSVLGWVTAWEHRV